MTEATILRPLTPHVPGTPCWVGLLVPEPDACREFYRALFGWEFDSGPQQPGRSSVYERALAGGHEVAGIGTAQQGARCRPAWLPYIATADAGTSTALVHECGGTVAVGPVEAGEEGRTAIAADPAGASFGIWQTDGRTDAGQPDGQTAAPAAHGTPVWHELVTYATAFVRPFYQHVLGCRVTETGEAGKAGSDHVTLRLGDRAVAGVHGVGHARLRDRGPHWRTYFAVEDTDAAAGEAARLGGTVLDAPHDARHGRLATVADPQGAQFTVVRPHGRGLHLG